MQTATSTKTKPPSNFDEKKKLLKIGKISFNFTGSGNFCRQPTGANDHR